MRPSNASLRWLLQKARKAQFWCALLALALGLSVADLVVEAQQQTTAVSSLTNDRTLQAAAADGLAVSPSRFEAALPALGFAVSSMVFLIALGLINGVVAARLPSAVSARERTGLLILGQLSLVLYGVRLIAPTSVPEATRNGLHLLAGLLLVSLALKCALVERRSSRSSLAVGWTLLEDDALVVAGLFLAAIPVVLWRLVGVRALPPGSGEWLSAAFFYLVILTLAALAYWLLAQRVASGAGPARALRLYDLDTATICGGVPLLLLPLSMLLANELQFALPNLELSTFVSAVSVGMLAAAMALFFLSWSGRLRVSGSALLPGLYYPIAIATLVALRTHRQTLDLGRLDYFESGRVSLPAQQLADFGRLPLLGLVPDRGLVDAGIPSLYTATHGVTDLDALIWLPWLPLVIGFLILYAFLSRLMSPLYAMLVTLLLPVGSAVVGAYSLALLPAVLVISAWRRPSRLRFITLWLVCGLLVLWRPGLGLASLIASLLAATLVLVLDKKTARATAAASLVIAAVAIPLALLAIDLVGAGQGGRAVIALLRKATDLRVGELGAVSLEVAAAPLLSFLAAFLPLVAAASLLVYLFQLTVRERSASGPGLAVLYLALFTLILPPRSAIGSDRMLLDPSLGLLLVAVMPLLLLPGRADARMLGRTSWLLSVLGLCAVLGLPAEFPLLGSGESFSFRHWQEGESRVRFDETPHRNLVAFLGRHLAAAETFFDFTGAPVLHVLTSKFYPLDEVEGFRESSETRQRVQVKRLQELRDEGRLPLILFSAPSRLGFADGRLPPALVHHRIAEFIYGGYVPWVDVEGWEVWRQRGRRMPRPGTPAVAVSPSRLVQHFDLGRLAATWAREDPWRSVERNDVQATLLNEPVVVRPGLPLDLVWNDPIEPQGGSYLHVRARPLRSAKPTGGGAEPPSLTVAYGEPRESSVTFNLAASKGLPPGADPSVSLPLLKKPRTHRVRQRDDASDRLRFRTGGEDPWVRRFVDLSGAPAVSETEELWLRLSYRSSQSGVGQLFFAVAEQRFSEKRSVKARVRKTGLRGAPAVITVPVVVGEPGDRLAGLRLDPPSEAEFEIVAVELLSRARSHDDYMIRMSTQWRWFQGEVRKLTLRASDSIVIDRIHLRAGD